MYDSEKEVGIDESEFNMALAILRRIDNLFTAASIASSSDDLARWYSLLITVAKEIRFNKDEANINWEYQKKINPLDYEYQSLKTRGKLHRHKFGYHRALLDYYESFLRDCFDERKMMNAGKSEKKLF